MKDQLAQWVAAGGRLVTWCQAHGVPQSTAYEWYKTDGFKRRVAAYRRPLVNRAIGEMVRGLSKAVGTIDRLIEQGETDRDKLAAATAFIDKLVGVRDHAGLKADIRQLGERIEALANRTEA